MLLLPVSPGQDVLPIPTDMVASNLPRELVLLCFSVRILQIINTG
jgi:hypothetical protein